MNALDVFRVRPDGSFVWVGSADSLPTALKVIKTLEVGADMVFFAINFLRQTIFRFSAQVTNNH
jgi:hypothetical protein